MNDDVQAPRDALIGLITATREARSSEILAQAREQAHARVRAAFHEARVRVSRAVEEERVRAHGMLALNEARLETHNRQRYQDAVQHMLARTRYRLDAALQARWQAPEQRRLWLGHLLEQALKSLPAAPWRIEHPPGWDDAELAPWRARIEAHAGAVPTLHSDDRIAGGLRVQAGGASLDATIAGLLADERAVQARLLALLEAALPPEEAP
ncbi:MAG: hypothetical protein WCZ87_02265 [Thiohalobacteraceae bacterium]